ncbi:HNH endonuclease signature motif containing protein [Bacillus sp. FJAT-45350]|uniref:HNH endonuclease signature motif containing protein n=1 Tax=Bacillus sp. FJAT-45350 TaxID=2011014 RepID=UPI000BB72964|nr:HNH endonuclease [Bacillus sp. FJAT-45350]
MAKYAILKSFYASEKWQRFRRIIVSERGPTCEHCGGLIAEPKDLHVHHIEELTPENVHDVSISLNPKMVMIVHHECHNKIHNRFGYKNKNRQVYIVYGPPLSGKTSFVKQYSTRGDLIVDIDRLYEAVTMLPSYDKPDQLLGNVIGIQSQLIDNIKTRYGKWNNAWVIGGYADKHKREKIANDLGAELIFCDVSKEECIRRLEIDVDRQYRQDEWRGYIEKWFSDYT